MNIIEQDKTIKDLKSSKSRIQDECDSLRGQRHGFHVNIRVLKSEKQNLEREVIHLKAKLFDKGEVLEHLMESKG